MGQPNHEPTNNQVWQGSIKLRYVAACGQPLASFDPVSSPQFWLAGFSTLSVQIGSFAAWLFRVNKAAWDLSTQTLSIDIVQKIQQFDVAIPELLPDQIYSSGQALSTFETIGFMLQGLNTFATQPLQVGTIDLGVPRTFVIGQQDGFMAASITVIGTETIYGKRSTRNPVSEVRTLTHQYWSFVTQDLTTEIVNVQNLDYNALPTVFAKPRSAAVVHSDIDNISFSAPRVVAHGSGDLPDPCAIDFKPPDNLDNRGNVKFQKTDLMSTMGVLFPSLGKNNTTPVVSQRKTVTYYYRYSSSVGLPPYENPIKSPPEDMDAASQLYMVVTEIQEPAGVVFPQLKADTTLIDSSRLVETARSKGNYTPYSKLYPASKPLRYDLVLEKAEQLKSNASSRGKGGVDANGNHTCTDLQKPAIVIQVPYALANQAFRGTVEVTQGVVPPLNFPFVYSIGYCHSNYNATKTAQRVAVREMARKYADTVAMPLPLEYLAAGCPTFAQAQIGGKIYMIDQRQIAIEVDAEARVHAELTFTGILLKQAAAVPEPVQPALYQPVGFANLAAQAAAALPISLNAVAGTTTYFSLGAAA